MKAAEVKNLLEQIVGSAEVLTRTNHVPFDIFAPEDYVYRTFDITYSAGNLTVYIEAKLGRKKRTSSNRGQLITPQDEIEYLDLVKAEENRIVEATKRQYGANEMRKGHIMAPTFFAEERVPHTTGILVDTADDTDLSTATVESVVIQYSLELGGIMQEATQKDYLDQVARLHDIRIQQPCYGTRGLLNTIGITSLDDIRRGIKPFRRGYWKAKEGRVFVAMLPKEELEKLEYKITSVYNAGMEVERAMPLMVTPVQSTHTL